MNALTFMIDQWLTAVIEVNLNAEYNEQLSPRIHMHNFNNKFCVTLASKSHVASMLTPSWWPEVAGRCRWYYLSMQCMPWDGLMLWYPCMVTGRTSHVATPQGGRAR